MVVKPRQVVYFDDATRRVIKISEYGPILNPATADGVSWFIYGYPALPIDIWENVNLYRIGIDRKFTKVDTEPSQEETDRFIKNAVVVDCLEALSRHISIGRFAKITNMAGYFLLIPEYQKEIEKYKTTGEAGPLLNSLVDDEEELPAAVAEFEISHQTAINFYILSEVQWNKWSRRIRKSTDPITVLNAFRESVGIK